MDTLLTSVSPLSVVIPADQPTGIHGRWVKVPGAALFSAVRASLGNLPLLAEDLGLITPEVEALREEFGFPGMKVLQMAFGSDPMAREYLPHNYPRNCVVYTATHDHNTTAGWFTAEPGTQTTQSREEVLQERALALVYLGTSGEEIHWDFIRLAMGSVADLVVFPIQDLFGLDTASRMNLPGTVGGNWEWRMNPEMLTPQVTQRLKEMTRIYDRYPRRL